jgi:hypothetical protein
MEDYPANSHKIRQMTEPEAVEEPKKIEKVVEGVVVRRKKPFHKRFTENVIGGDLKTVGSYVMMEVLLPAVKDTIADAMSQGVERMLFGEARSTSRRPGTRLGTYNGYVSYNRYSPSASNRMGRKEDRANPGRRARAPHDFDDLILETRVEAEEVINRLFELVARYESASVADLYELVGAQANYTDDKWGWIDMQGANVRRVPRGYLLNLPRPEPIE